jgi:hypothetical protein
MPNLGSCDAIGPAWEQLLVAQAQGAAKSAEAAPQDEALRNVSRDFASLLYSTLWRQMQETTLREAEDEEEEAVKEGVQDFVGTFLPQAVAGCRQDPLSGYIYEHLGKLRGEQPDGRS